MENVNHKKKVVELEGEVKKLSGQQNIQQRIHHHARITARYIFSIMCSVYTENMLIKFKRIWTC
jgi:kinesin family protein 15